MSSSLSQCVCVVAGRVGRGCVSMSIDKIRVGVYNQEKTHKKVNLRDKVYMPCTGSRHRKQAI